MMTTDQVALRQIQQALRAGKRLSDDQFEKLAHLRRSANVGKRYVATESVEKFALREGEELWDFVDAIWMAVQTNRVVLADGSLDAWLTGIFENYVIVQDMNTGRTFKSEFTRDGNGEFTFSEPVQVTHAWVPVEVPEDADEVERAVAKRAPAIAEYVEIGKRGGGKWSFLPPNLRRRRK
jgi:hypothetical protein